MKPIKLQNKMYSKNSDESVFYHYHDLQEKI